jgi:succinyl-CoA synthetase beta subunit
MIGHKLVTDETGPEGKICNSVMIAERKFSRREFYFAIVLDTKSDGPVVIASRQGGVKIEDTILNQPDAVFYHTLDISKGMTKETAAWITRHIGICYEPEETIKMLCNLYKLFAEKDVLKAEINPWIEDICMNYYALEVKLEFDPRAEHRQWEVFGMIDESQEDPKQTAARKLSVSYAPLGGSIGCMSNSSGLATNDLLRLHGGRPSNFLDIGSMASAETVKKSIEVILMDPAVRTILVNIFGGIMRCDVVAEGLLKAIREFDIKIPIIARLQGNKSKEGLEMIKNSNHNIITCDSIGEAAEMAVRCSSITKLADEGDLEAILKMKNVSNCKHVSLGTKVDTSKKPTVQKPTAKNDEDVLDQDGSWKGVPSWLNPFFVERNLTDDFEIPEKSMTCPTGHKRPLGSVTPREGTQVKAKGASTDEKPSKEKSSSKTTSVTTVPLPKDTEKP